MGFRSPDLLGLGLPVENVREIVVDRTTLKDRDIENMLLFKLCVYDWSMLVLV